MAEYRTQLVVQPELQMDLLTMELRAVCQALGIGVFYTSRSREAVYLASYDYSASGTMGSTGEIVDEDLLHKLLQDVIRRSPGLTFITIEIAYTCTELNPDAFGGAAVFITADRIENISTSRWLTDKKRELNGEKVCTPGSSE